VVLRDADSPQRTEDRIQRTARPMAQDKGRGGIARWRAGPLTVDDRTGKHCVPVGISDARVG